MTSPVAAVTCGSAPSAFSVSHSSAVRRSCQTIALAISLPVTRSQMSAVSRWLAMPIAARLLASHRARLRASRAVESVVSHSASGLCSTQPGRG